MDPAQIVILIIAGIGILVFIKYKISGSLRTELGFVGWVLDRGYPVFAGLACTGSLIAAGVGLLAIADLVIPAKLPDSAVITRKKKIPQAKRGASYTIYAKGHVKEYGENVSALLFGKAKKGDTIEISLTRFFREWKRVRLIRDGAVIYESRGMDVYGMAIFGVLFILTLYSFRLAFKFRTRRILGSIVLIGMILFELIPLAILVCSPPVLQ